MKLPLFEGDHLETNVLNSCYTWIADTTSLTVDSGVFKE